MVEKWYQKGKYATVDVMTPIEKDPARGFNAAIAAELRAERSAQRITFDDLADRSGISKQTLLRIFNDKRAVSMAYLEAICAELDVPMSLIVNRAETRLGEEGSSAEIIAFPAPVVVEPDFESMAALDPGYGQGEHTDQ